MVKKQVRDIIVGDRIRYVNNMLMEPHPGLNLFTPMESTVLDSDRQWHGINEGFRYKFKTVSGWLTYLSEDDYLEVSEERPIKSPPLAAWASELQPEQVNGISIN